MKVEELMDMCRYQVEKKGLSLKVLAGQVGVSKSALGHWLTGKRTPSLENMLLLLDVLGVELRVYERRESVNRGSSMMPSWMN